MEARNTKERNRMRKYPETDCFTFDNENPAGKITGDCVIRAVAGATGKSWDEVMKGMFTMAMKTKWSLASKENMDAYLESVGWEKQKQPRKPDGTKYTGEEWCAYLNNLRKYSDGSPFAAVANIGGNHTVCVKGGEGELIKIHDIWDSTGGCIGNYWIKGEQE